MVVVGGAQWTNVGLCSDLVQRTSGVIFKAVVVSEAGERVAC